MACGTVVLGNPEELLVPENSDLIQLFFLGFSLANVPLKTSLLRPPCPPSFSTRFRIGNYDGANKNSSFSPFDSAR